MKKNNIAEKISLLNNTTLESLNDDDRAIMIKRFTETALRILNADFGFAWWREVEGDDYYLAYKSPSVPYEPNLPRPKGGNEKAQRSREPVFVEKVRKENYEPQYDVSPYMRSYIIIPVCYKSFTYGNLVVCFKNYRVFTPEEKSLCLALGNSAAQATTISHLYFDLKDFKNRLDKTLDSIFIFSPRSLRIEYANEGAVRYLGFKPAELLKKNFFDIQGQYSTEDFIKLLLPLMLGQKESLTVETTLRPKKGRPVPVELLIQLTGSAPGSKKFLTIVHDLTSRKKVEKQSLALLKQKDEFFSIASHELKTPVTTIKGFSQLLGSRLKGDDVDAKQYLSKINVHIGKMNSLIEDFLDVSSITAGKLKFQDSKFELRSLVKETVEDLKVSIKDHALIFTGDKGEFLISGDPGRMAQVLSNLITNAAKYSEDGTKINVSLEKAEGFIKVKVEDFGIGVPEKYRSKIFKRFFQAKNRSVQAYNGLGLGLYISSLIIHHHGGFLDFHSKKKGTIFYFTLPYNEQK